MFGNRASRRSSPAQNELLEEMNALATKVHDVWKDRIRESIRGYKTQAHPHFFEGRDLLVDFRNPTERDILQLSILILGLMLEDHLVPLHPGLMWEAFEVIQEEVKGLMEYVQTMLAERDSPDSFDRTLLEL